MPQDRYGLTLSTASPAARDAYVSGVDRLLAGKAGAQQAFEQALAADAGFALAHAALARALQLHGQPQAARQSAAQARELADGLPRQERGNVEMLTSLVQPTGVAPLALATEHLAEFPRDAMVLAPCTGVFGLIGFSGRAGRAQEQLAQLEPLAQAYGDDAWFLATHAFALSELGHLDRARRAIDRAMALDAHSAHGIHVHTHVLYESGEDAAGLADLREWLRDYPREALLHCHLSWHVALWSLEQGQPAQAWQVYRRDVHPGASWGPAINALSDAASFLWRAELAGQAREAALWREVSAYAQREFPKAGVSFADVHSALAHAVAQDAAALATLTAQLHQRLAAGKLAAGPIVPALAEAFAACAREDWEAVISAIAPVLDQHERIGGSRAQRDLVDYTLAMARIRAGQQPPGPLLRQGGRGAVSAG